MFNYPGASCALQFDLNLPESCSYWAGAHFSAPLTAQLPAPADQLFAGPSPGACRSVVHLQRREVASQTHTKKADGNSSGFTFIFFKYYFIIYLFFSQKAGFKIRGWGKGRWGAG